MDTVKRITKWTGLVRDVGLILGAPTLLTLGYFLQQQQMEVLKAQNEHLRATQFDRVYALLDSQKKIYEFEVQVLEAKLKKAEATNDIANAKLFFPEIGKTRDAIAQIAEVQKTWKVDKLGPITLTIGPKPDAPPNDRISRLQFAIGTSF